MDWLQRINSAIDYIEENLENEIDIKEIAKITCCSVYHFPRLFSSMADISLSEYIRRRRLSLAAFELQNSKSRIIDIAIKYGYDSPDSFSRAFQKLHGITPSMARKTGVNLKAFPKISFHITIKGDIEMEYRIEELDFEFPVVGMRHSVVTEKAFELVPKLWEEASTNGLVKQLIDMSWVNPKCKLESILGVCGTSSAIMDEEFDYFMGVRYEGEIPKGMESMIIPKSTWAVFPNVSKAWKRLYTEWLPESGYELADLPCIECYYKPGHIPGDELWVPVVRAQDMRR